MGSFSPHHIIKLTVKFCDLLFLWYAEFQPFSQIAFPKKGIRNSFFWLVKWNRAWILDQNQLKIVDSFLFCFICWTQEYQELPIKILTSMLQLGLGVIISLKLKRENQGKLGDLSSEFYSTANCSNESF